MSNQVAVQKSRDLKQFLDRPAVQAKIRELVDKNSASFATSIMQIANSNPQPPSGGCELKRHWRKNHVV